MSFDHDIHRGDNQAHEALDATDDLHDLYQQVILDHSRAPRNFRELPDADGRAEGFNPVCGDRVTVAIKRDGDRIGDIAFTGKGCAICTASASMMTQFLKGRSIDEVERAFHQFHDLLAGAADNAPSDSNHAPDHEHEHDHETDALGKLVVFAGVRKYPVRVKCATLPWHTLKSAMEHNHTTVTTE